MKLSVPQIVIARANLPLRMFMLRENPKSHTAQRTSSDPGPTFTRKFSVLTSRCNKLDLWRWCKPRAASRKSIDRVSHCRRGRPCFTRCCHSVRRLPAFMYSVTMNTCTHKCKIKNTYCANQASTEILSSLQETRPKHVDRETKKLTSNKQQQKTTTQYLLSTSTRPTASTYLLYPRHHRTSVQFASAPALSSDRQPAPM